MSERSSKTRRTLLIREGMLGRKGIFTKKRRKLLQELEIDEVNRCLSVIDVLDNHIRDLSAMIRGIAGESQGVGYYPAIAALAVFFFASHFLTEENLYF